MNSWRPGKTAAVCRAGVVAAQNRLAAEAGAGVLARGGNAVDAAVVTTLVLSVVEPWLSGVGGGGYMVHADPTGRVDVLDFSMVAARGLDPADYPLAEGKGGDLFDWPAVDGNRNAQGYGSICVPGAIAGLAEALRRYGTLSWAEALGPAITHAEAGLEIDWYAALAFTIDAPALARDPAAAALFLDQGRAPVPGDGRTVRRKPMPAKAAMLRRLAEAGARDFYEGEVAALLAADLTEGGSAIARDDLAAYRPVWSAPITASHLGWDVSAPAGLTGGPSFLDALADLCVGDAVRADEPELYAAVARAVRAAYDRRLATMGHAAVATGDSTTHVSVIDRDGRAVSLTNTLLSRFGARVVLPRTGILANNGMMWFDPRPDRPNSIAPGAKPLANMCPLVLRAPDGRLLAIGAAGGRKIFPAVLQLVAFVCGRGLGLEAAFHAPRIEASEATIVVDRRAGSAVVDRIARDFPVVVADDTVYPVRFAIPSAVLRQADGAIIGMGHPTSPWSDAVGANAIGMDGG